MGWFTRKAQPPMSKSDAAVMLLRPFVRDMIPRGIYPRSDWQDLARAVSVNLGKDKTFEYLGRCLAEADTEGHA